MTGRKRLLLLVSLVALVAIAPGVALADHRPAPTSMASRRTPPAGPTSAEERSVREPSGYSNSGGYARIPSASGVGTRLGKDTSPDSCTFGGGPQTVYGAPHKIGGYSSIFPTGGYTTGSTSTSTRSGRPRTPTSDSTGRPRSTTRSASTATSSSRRDRALGLSISGKQRDPMRCNPRTRCVRPFP